LSIKFINGRKIDISLVFCSFEPFSTGKSLFYWKGEVVGA
jgi:hypothetical protein